MIYAFFKAVLDYFWQDPLRLLTMLGGSGGFVYWINLYRNRMRIRIRMFREKCMATDNQKTFLEFEAESIGNMPTSLEPKIILTGYSPKHEFRVFEYLIDSHDRSLSPNVPKPFEASTKYDKILPHLFYKTYRFTPTRGKSLKIRIRNAKGVVLSFPRFLYECLIFRIFGKFPNS